MTIIRGDQLASGEQSREFVGEEHGGVAVSFILVNAPSGHRVRLHLHAYDEIFIVQEGEATAVIGDEEVRLRAGDIAVVRAGQPHGFVNSGETRLRQVDIHVSPRFVTEWLEAAPSDPPAAPKSSGEQR